MIIITAGGIYCTRRHFSDLAASVEGIYFLNACLCVFLYILKSGEKHTHFTGKVRIFWLSG